MIAQILLHLSVIECPILVKKDQNTVEDSEEPKIDREDFAEDVPDVAVIKVKVKVG